MQNYKIILNYPIFVYTFYTFERQMLINFMNQSTLLLNNIFIL